MLQEHSSGTLKVGSPTMQTGRSASLMVILGLISTKRTAFSRHFQVKMYQSGWTFHVARTLWSSLGSTRCAVNQTRVRTEIFVALCLPKRVRGRFRVLIRLRSTYYDFATTDYRVSHFVQLTGCCLNGGSVQPSLIPLYFDVFLMFWTCLIIQYGRFFTQVFLGYKVEKN